VRHAPFSEFSLNQMPRAPLSLIQQQTEKLSCNGEPDFMLFALAL